MDHVNRTLDDLLEKFRPVMGKDYYKYRNHVYRVFLNCLIIDRDQRNEDKYAVASVFHDIGIWTNHTIDYLNPSVAQARLYLADNGK